MSDVNRGPISSTEKQFLDDLEIAKRLSLDEYEKEKRRWSKPFSNHSSNSKRISSTPQHENFTDDKSRKISITPRPRPFSRAVSTNTSGGSSGTHLSTSVSAGKIIQLPSPVSIDPPPESLLRRNRSLPYRYRNNQRRDDNNTIDGTTSPSSTTTTTTTITRSSVASNSNGNNLNDTDGSITLPSAPSSSTTLNNFNSASDDLILLASPKVTPKFPLSGLKLPNFCDISSSSTISISSNGSNILSPSLTNDSLSPTPLNGAIDLRSTFNPMYQVSPAPSEPLHFNNNGHLKTSTSMTFPIPTSSSPIVRINNNKLSLGGIRIPPALSPTSTPTLLFQQTKTKQTPTAAAAKTAMSGVYSKLSEQLKSLSCQEDLIDLGQTDGRNILEYFDPILLREKTRDEDRADAHEGNNSHQFQTNVITSPTTTSKLSSNRDSFESSSFMSTTTASFSYHAGGPPTLSLYPSLQEFHNTDNLYGGLDHENDKDDASSFYDVYNPFEYLYTVSCSSPSASSTYESNFSNSLSTPSLGRSLGFSHFTESQPLPSPFPTQTSSSVFPPALPPRNSEISLEQFVQPITAPSAKVPLRFTASSASNTCDVSKRHGRLYENIESVKHFASTDSEIQAFYEMIRELRFSNRHVDSTTNGGFIRCSTLEAKCLEALSLKIVVWKDEDILSEPAAFTSDVSASPDMIIDQSLMNLELGGSGRDYLLRVKGLNEYMCSDVPLAKYRYVQECIKLDQDIHLILVPKVLMGAKSWARTPRDDADCVGINIDDILPQTHSKTITYKDIRIPLEVIDRESDKLKEKLAGSFTTKDVSSLQLSSASLIQPVKAVCVLLGEVQTVENIECLDAFAKMCNDWNAKVKNTITTMEGESRRRTKIGNDCNNRLSFVEILPRHNLSSVLGEALKDNILSALYRLEDSVRHLVEMYSKSFPVSFRMKEPSETIRVGWNSSCKPMSDMIESFLLRVGAVHRLKPEWLTSYTEYYLTAEVFHGRRWMGKATTGNKTVTKSDNNLFFNTVVFHSWINFEHLPVCILPRESRVVLTLYGRKQNEDNNSIYDTVELAWTSMQCFNFKGLLAQGKYLLPFWPVGLVQKKLGPAPDSSFSSDENAPLLTIEFTDFGYDLPFPEVPSAVLSRRDFNSLDPGTQVLLKDIFEHSTFTKFPPEVVEVLWEKRHYLHEFPGALPKVLLAAQLWDWASLAELHAMLHCWEPLEPIDSLQLLLPCFPDAKVREQGIHWVSKMPDEELINMLPQLMEALSFETFDYSPLARFLLKKALSCLKISHHLFWLLVSQVGLGKWASEFSSDSQIISSIPPPDSHNVYDPKRRRLELMFNSMMIMSGAKWKAAFISQVKLMEGFYDVATQVKATSSSSRQSVLMKELHRVQTCIFSACNSIPLPLSPSYDVATIDIKSCSYFTSASVPLKIGFVNGLAEKGNIATLYKVGDDIRQDMLTIQIIRVVEKWWLEAGLDLRVITFSCVPTGFKQGFVEMVPNAETLCRIQAEHGLTGAFRNRPISEWLAKMNPSTLDYRRAIENFTLSCAAYCVVTYILGICDRHNDNIMLTKKGHLFHIDFGKFLGDAQMFGSIIKRDRSPFVLTSDMVYVINDGEKDSSKFHRFVELCCQAFRIVRENGDTLLNLFALMATAGIPGVNNKSVIYVQDALLPDCSNSEAAARFASFIQESLQNWFTPVNFFLHTLAQMPFPSDSSDDPTKLSFVPNVYTMEMDGRIEGVKLVSFVKKYDPEKFYVYTVQVRRRGQTEWTNLNRSYKEFLEFHTKLCINFPKAVGTLGSLPRGSGLTRSQVKQVTEKRKVILQAFLEALFTLADEISHSHLVYTFFHPLLRDEEQHQEDEKERKNSSRVSLSRNPARIHGQIKISLEYQRGALHVLILHAVDLTCPSGTPPSPYVKIYLQPDPARKTKRKTKVVKRSQHPTFMEMIEYRLPLELIRIRTLSVSVWHHDPFQENNFLGGVSIPMSSLTVGKETTGTHTLGNINSFL